MRPRDIIAGALLDLDLLTKKAAERYAASILSALAAAGYRIVPPPAANTRDERPGLYRNIETGMLRTFPLRGPRHGKWKFCEPLPLRALRKETGG